MLIYNLRYGGCARETFGSAGRLHPVR